MEGKIYEAIPKIMAEIGAIGKNQRNIQQNFMFRGIDAVMNGINPALIKHGVFIVPEVLEQTREERTTVKGSKLIYSICKIKFSFCAEDGSHVDAITIGEGMDSGDKATNKAMAIAFKYACFQIFCIPTEEMKDPDAECHEIVNEKIEETKVKAIKSLAEKKGISEAAICSRYKVSSFAEMTFDIWNRAMQAVEKSADKPKGAA